MISAFVLPDRFVPSPCCWWRLKIALGELLGWGWWYWDMTTNELAGSRTLESIYGVPHDPRGYSVESYQFFIDSLWDSEAEAYVEYSVRQAIEEKCRLKYHFRIRKHDTGEKGIILGIGWVKYAPDGQTPIAFYGWNKERTLSDPRKAMMDASLELIEKSYALESNRTRNPTPESLLGAAAAFLQLLSTHGR